MAKAPRFLIEVQPETPEGVELALDASRILKEEHGMYGARVVGHQALTAEELELPTSVVVAPQEDGDFTLNYNADDSEQIVPTKRDSLSASLSQLALHQLRLKPELQSSRADRDKLIEFSGPHPAIDKDPSRWIFENPFIADLARVHPQYGNLIRFLCNERGLFLKVGNYPKERAYWNSTTNGGLPIVRKSDPIHEGTFMLHDLFHFVPTDPIIGEGRPTKSQQQAYIVHRMMSEASTQILADMLAVEHAGLEEKGYDISKRQIFPVLRSIKEANDGEVPSLEKLLAANVYFCFTGDTKGFELLGASAESLEGFREKYESVFYGDFKWNSNNLYMMNSDMLQMPRIADYQAWLQHVGGFPALTNYSERVATPDGVNIAEMLSNFRGAFNAAASYQQPIDELKRHKTAARKYLAGQRIVFARYGNIVDPGGLEEEFDEAFHAAANARDTVGVTEASEHANSLVSEYLSRPRLRRCIFPHELAMASFSAPLYPVVFLNYEWSKEDAGSDMMALTASFARDASNTSDELSRMLEIVES